MDVPTLCKCIGLVCVVSSQSLSEWKESMLTAIGIEETNISIFVSADYHPFHTTGACRSVDYLLLRHCPIRVQIGGAIEPDGGGNDRIDTSGGCSVVSLQTGHTDNLLSCPSVVDENRSIRTRYNEIDTRQG